MYSTRVFTAQVPETTEKPPRYALSISNASLRSYHSSRPFGVPVSADVPAAAARRIIIFDRQSGGGGGPGGGSIRNLARISPSRIRRTRHVLPFFRQTYSVSVLTIVPVQSPTRVRPDNRVCQSFRHVFATTTTGVVTDARYF